MEIRVLGSILCLMAAVPFTAFADEPQPPSPSKPDGVIGGYEYVDLGLPSGTLWATYNVGATSPYEKGQYFAWGEVEPREDFSWESYKFFIDYHIDPETGNWVVLQDIGADIRDGAYWMRVEDRIIQMRNTCCKAKQQRKIYAGGIWRI